MNSAQKEEQGHQLMAEADKKQSTRSGFFRSLFGSSTNKEEVAETYVRAANAFKLAKSWTFAAKAFEKAAVTYSLIADMQYDAATKYVDAGKAYKNVEPAKAIEPFEKAIKLHADDAKFQQCARLKKDVAEIYESQGGDDGNKLAMEAYSAAADYYDLDDAKANANSMRVKLAALQALAGEYAQAAELYESIAQMALASNLLKYGAREHLLRAGLCHLCQGDVIGAERAVDKYGDMDTSFPTSREGRLLSGVVAAVNDSAVDEFTNHIREYDSVSSLDSWKTTILLKIKNQITTDEGLEEDLT